MLQLLAAAKSFPDFE